jgi:hypothetical protein
MRILSHYLGLDGGDTATMTSGYLTVITFAASLFLH